MVDIVDEEVELHLIDTRQLVNEAKKLKEAQRIKAEQNKLLKKDHNQLREEKELLDRLKQKKKPLTFSGSPALFIDSKTDETILSSEAKKQTRKGAITGQKTTSAFTDMQKKIKEFERKQKDTKKQLSKLQSDILGNFKNAQSLATGGIGIGAVGGIFSRFGPIGIMVAAIAVPLITQIMQQFQRGGVLSLFLKEKIQVKTITDEEEFNQVRSGNKFLTSDLRIVQGVPKTSNTQNLKYEHVRFTAQTLGQ